MADEVYINKKLFSFEFRQHSTLTHDMPKYRYSINLFAFSQKHIFGFYELYQINIVYVTICKTMRQSNEEYICNIYDLPVIYQSVRGYNYTVLRNSMQLEGMMAIGYSLIHYASHQNCVCVCVCVCVFECVYIGTE